MTEAAIVVVMLTFLVMGIVEVGWAFMRSSMIVHAARDGARFGATLASTLRNASGCLTGAGTTTIQDHVTEALNTVGFASDSIGVVQNTCAANEVPTIEVTVTGPLDLLFGFMGTSFDVDRSVTFEDENRVCPSAC
jgi:Flp pilus assembly protein TadG